MNDSAPQPSAPDSPPSQGGMEIDPQRGRRIGTTFAFWIFVLALAVLLTYLLATFTHSLAIAIAFAAGMLCYMLIAGAITSRHLSRPPGDGRLH